MHWYLLLFDSWQTEAQMILSLQWIKLGALYNAEQRFVDTKIEHDKIRNILTIKSNVTVYDD